MKYMGTTNLVVFLHLLFHTLVYSNSYARTGPVNELKKKVRICTTPSTSRNKTKFCITSKRSVGNIQNVRPYKDAFTSKIGVILCSGPSLQNYTDTCNEGQGRRLLHVGVNGVVNFRKGTKFTLDFLFANHGYTDNLETLRVLAQAKVHHEKFFARFREGKGHDSMSERNLKRIGGRYFYAVAPACEPHRSQPFVKDVGNYEFGGSCSTVFMALQFILYTGANMLYVFNALMTAWLKGTSNMVCIHSLTRIYACSQVCVACMSD
mmetsp:Transcript_34747/g.75973  ORF Transcript_34747/g.75973 Transcript_34747/m.75973 type:complete len:264 (+) Transcript_34747:144-935(+)